MAQKKQKGLGMGLGALLGDVSANISNDFEYLQISKIEPRHDQPRVAFEKEPLEELAASVREHGVLSPITVRPLGEGFYQIIAGERRWRAAKMAEIAEIPARILNADDKTAMELSLVENLQREDLNPIEEALGYRALGDDFGLTQEEVAQRMGKSRPAITNALRLLTLPDELVEMVRRGGLAPGSARALAAVKNRDAMVKAAREVVSKGFSTREAEALARRLNRPERVRPERINYLEEYEDNLSKALGRKVRIAPAGRGAAHTGRIEIEYYGDDDFERLYNGIYSLGSGGADGRK
ncbi:MAG: ParB/RepB/Spo0J family partition protein [Clostridiales bacterium]|nr:ParB/RepB/Spo0J family partition protein [Clostridiales bacterium]